MGNGRIELPSLPNSGDIVKGAVQGTGFLMDPFNVTGIRRVAENYVGGKLIGPDGKEIGPADPTSPLSLEEQQRRLALLQREKEYMGKADAYSQQLQDISSGKVQDPAMALQNQLNLSQQIAAAKANRGANAALAGRNAAQAAVQTNAMQNAAGIANAKQQYGGFLQGQQGMAQQGVQGNIQNATQLYGIDKGAQSQKDLAESERKSREQSSMLGAGAQLGAALIPLMSDKTQKTNIQDGSKAVDHFLNAISAHTYNYKNPDAPGAGEGKFLGVMAQDLEKAGPEGESMVKDTQYGKMVDYGKGFGAILAAQAQLNERMKKLEKKG